MRVLGEHAVSLREAGFDLSNENLASLFVDFFRMKSWRKKYRRELKRMNSVSLDERMTLRDVLRITDPCRLQQLATNEKFKRIITGRNFLIYGYLARLQYRRGRRDAKITETVLALQKLYAHMNDNKGLPYECAETLVRYMTWADEGHVIHAASLM